MRLPSRLLPVALGFALATSFAFSAEPDTFAAVRATALPIWPEQLGPRYYGGEQPRVGTVDVDIAIGPDGIVYSADTAWLKTPKSKRKPKEKHVLEDEFHVAAIRAMLHWRYAVPADLCGLLRGKQSFDFDGSRTPAVAIAGAAPMVAEAQPSVEQVLAPVTIAGQVIDPQLAYRDSMARRMPFSVAQPLAVRSPLEALAARSPGASDLVPAALESWAIEALVAATDIREPRQLVFARFTIGIDGSVSGVEADQRFGDDDFGEAVQALLHSAKFKPASRAGVPVSVRVCQSFSSAVFAFPPPLG